MGVFPTKLGTCSKYLVSPTNKNYSLLQQQQRRRTGLNYFERSGRSSPRDESCMNQNQAIESSENWDDDFEFQQSNEPNLGKHQVAAEPRFSVASSAFAEDWDTERIQQNIKHSSSMVLGHRKSHPAPALEEWAEPGPSTPTKRSTTQAENWDDDFEDRTEFPAKRHPHAYSLKTRHSYHTPPRLKSASDPENWDDDFETDKTDTTPMTKRTRQEAYPDSSDDEAELGFTDKEEDRTVTACSRPQLKLRQSPPPPVPALPLSLLSPVEPFPRSPTVSVFSIPTTSGRNSVGYTSTSHLALRPSASGGSLAMLPPSPPIHRERRRLRKKSRPPHIENNVFELIEEQRDSPPPLPPSTPERPSTSPLPQSDTGSTGPQKTPLLSRIGSVKWGVRKKRASTGPAEVMMHDLGHEDQEHTPRPPSSLTSVLSSSSRPSWFFRSGGALGSGSPPPPHAAELKHEKSMNSIRSTMLSTPSKLSKRKSSKMFDPSSSSEVVGTPGKPSLLSAARRPTSMQVPQGKVLSTSTGTRHTSYGSSVGRVASQTFSHPHESVEDLQSREGSRGFMGSMRKISLISGTKHKRQKSTAEVTPLPPVPMSPTFPLPDESEHPDQLLPPIELQPPSPPRTLNGVTTSHSAPNNISQGVESLFVPSSSAPVSLSPKASPVSASRGSPGKASSPQSASLGRATQVPLSSSPSASVPRRNSLGDLKIPARISQAQISLKRDLGMVREFAASVDKLKELRAIHHHLISEVHTALTSPPLSRAASPPMIQLTRPRSRLRSNTEPKASLSENKHLAAVLNAITAKYKIPWECAELLIELGGGTPSSASPPSSTVSAPAAQADIDLRKSRERAVTLSGEESKFPSGFVGSAATAQSNLSWRSSSGRHDLTQRQLVLLRDILNSTDGALPDDALVPEETDVNRQWRWGDAMSSTVTLPSEESVQTSQDGKKRRHSRMGMSGLRDMLRSLKRSYSSQPPPPLPASTTSLSTQSSMGSQSQHHYSHAHLPRSHPQRSSKTSTGPESAHYTGDAPNSPYNGQSLKYKASPRRPSLASIFRLGQKNKNVSSGAESSLDSVHGSRCASRGSATTEEEDWDQIDFVTDLDGAARALGIDGSSTIKGKKGRSPYLNHSHEMRPISPTRKREACSSQTSLKCELSPRSIRPMRSTRLSNVEEVVDDRHVRSKSNAQHRISRPRTSPSRPPSRNYKLAISGSVRSAPPQPPDGDSSLLSEFKLSMTPENIKPLLDNAKEVHLRLNECIREVRALLDASTNSPSS